MKTYICKVYWEVAATVEVQAEGPVLAAILAKQENLEAEEHVPDSAHCDPESDVVEKGASCN